MKRIKSDRELTKLMEKENVYLFDSTQEALTYLKKQNGLKKMRTHQELNTNQVKTSDYLIKNILKQESHSLSKELRGC